MESDVCKHQNKPCCESGYCEKNIANIVVHYLDITYLELNEDRVMKFCRNRQETESDEVMKFFQKKCITFLYFCCFNLCEIILVDSNFNEEED